MKPFCENAFLHFCSVVRPAGIRCLADTLSEPLDSDGGLMIPKLKDALVFRAKP